MAIAWPSGDTGKENENYRDYRGSIGYSGHCLALRRSFDGGVEGCGFGIVG